LTRCGIEILDWSEWFASGKVPKAAVNRIANELGLEPEYLSRVYPAPVERTLDKFLDFLKVDFGSNPRDVGRLFMKHAGTIENASYRGLQFGNEADSSWFRAVLRGESLGPLSDSAQSEYFDDESEWEDSHLR
jgi:hypothetical protein